MAWRVPAHGSAGRGARQRRAPTGGWAKGIERQTFAPVTVSVKPTSVPVEMVRVVAASATGGAVTVVAGAAQAARASRHRSSAARFMVFPPG